jgi:hypothetical protein
MNQSAVKRIEVVGTSKGLDELTQELRGVSSAQDQVAKSGESVARVQDTSARRQISVADAYRRLQSQLDATVRSQALFERGQRVLDRALEQGLVDAQQYGASLQELKERYDGATIAARANQQAATALRATLNPLAAAQDQMNAELAQYGALASAGAISAQELAQAQVLAKSRFDAATHSLRANTVAMNDNRGSRAAATNAMFQMQDIGMMALSGQSPLLTAVQQGTQLAGVLGPMGAAGAARALGSAIIGLVNPVSLLAVGLTGLAAAAIQYFASWREEGGDVNETLEKHNRLIQDVAQKWGAALPALKSYADRLKETADAAERLAAAAARTNELYVAPRAQFESSGLPDSALVLQDLRLAGEDAEVIRSFQAAFESLRAEMDAGTASAQDVQAVMDILNGTIIAGSDPVQQMVAGLSAFAAGLAPVADEASRVNQEVLFLNNGLKGLIAVMGQSLTALDQFNRTPFQTPEQMREWTEERERQLQVERDFAETTADLLRQNRRPNDIERLDAEEEAAERAGRAQDELTSSYDRTVERAAERNAQMRVELGSLGDLSAAAEAAAYSQQLISQAMSEGTALSEPQIARIKALAAEYVELSRAMALAKAEQDLQFEREQIGRSDVEQRVYAELRNLGLDINSIDGQRIADNIRINEALAEQRDYAEDLRDTLREGASNFLHDLFTGKDVMESIVQLGSRLASMNFDRLVDMFSGNGGGFGGLFGGAPAAKTSMPVDYGTIRQTGTVLAEGVAPVLEKSTSAQVQAFMGALKQVESGGNYGARGPMTSYGRPLGAYQVLPENVANWSREFLGRAVTAGEWMKDAAIQDKVVAAKLTQLSEKFPDMRDWAAIWNSGRPLSQSAGVRDQVFGTTVSSYVDKVMGAMPDAVRTGALQGTKQGSTEGTYDAWAGLREVTTPTASSPQQQQNGLGTGLMQNIGAALGGFSLGYQSGNAGMGAIGGALQGFGATGTIFGAVR